MGARIIVSNDAILLLSLAALEFWDLFFIRSMLFCHSSLLRC